MIDGRCDTAVADQAARRVQNTLARWICRQFPSHPIPSHPTPLHTGFVPGARARVGESFTTQQDGAVLQFDTELELKKQQQQQLSATVTKQYLHQVCGVHARAASIDAPQTLQPAGKAE